MSDTEQGLVDLDTTIEAHDLEKVLAIMDNAAKEAKTTGDFLSYSTVLDMYMSDPEKFTKEEREQLLNHLLEILKADHDLVYEIGWDLPALVVPFLESNYEFNARLRMAPCVWTVLKIFEVLALHGNPKELFLKSTELLSTLREDDARSDDAYYRMKFYDVKLYCIFELVDSCLRRIHTLYPSRFLGMTVASFINSLYVNPVANFEEAQFRWKRVYTFARNYQRPPLPEKIDVSQEELEKINADEDFLQRKLLTGLVTESLNMAMKLTTIGFATDFFDYLQSLSGKSYESELDAQALDRLYELALSFDIEVGAVFKKFVEESSELVDLLMLEGKNDDELQGHLFEKLVVSFQKDMANSLVNNEANNVQDSIGGALVLFTYAVENAKDMTKVALPFRDIIGLALRLVVPGMIHSSFINKGYNDMVVFWSWYSIHQATLQKTNLSLELSKIPKLLLQSYFQVLLFILITSRTSPELRFTTLTLLTKVLAHAPEETSYSFLIDSLRECPYENLKTALVGVLKELVFKQKTDFEDLSDKLEKASINDKDAPARPPPLPKRNSSRSTRYITLTQERVDELLDIIRSSIEDTLISDELINENAFPTLVALLNFLILLKKEKLVEEEPTDKIVADLKEKIKKIEENKKEEAEAPSTNFAGILSVTVERLAN